MIRGIDTQVAVQRLADYAKEASSQVRRGDLARDFSVDLTRAQTEVQPKQVQNLEQKNDPRLRLRERDQEGQARKGKQQGGGDEDQEQPQGQSKREDLQLASGVIPEYHVHEPKKIRGVNIDVEI